MSDIIKIVRSDIFVYILNYWFEVFVNT